MGSRIDNIIDNALELRTLQRVVAFFVDLVICFTIAVFPKYGIYAAVLYFIFRDVLPFGSHRSLGKSVYQLKVVPINGEPRTISWRQAFVRNIVTFIPFVNIYDVYLFLATGERLADQWSDCHVILMPVKESDDNKSSSQSSSPSSPANLQVNADDVRYDDAESGAEDEDDQEVVYSTRVACDDSVDEEVTDYKRYSGDVDYVDTRSMND